MHSADLVDTSPLRSFVPSPTRRSKGFLGALFTGVARLRRRGSTTARRCIPPSPAPRSTPRRARTSRRRTAGRRPRGARRTRAPWVNPGGISSQWCVTRTIGGLPGRRPGRRDAGASAPGAQVETGEGLVEQHQLGIAHERAGQQHLLALAFRDHPEGAVAELPHATAASSRVRPLPILRRIPVPPRLESSVSSAGHHVTGREVCSQLPGDGAADQRHARAQRPDIDLPESRSQHLHRAGGRPQPGGRHLEQRRLARAVGTQDDPAVTNLDAPVDPPQHRHPFAPDHDVMQRDGGSGSPRCAHALAPSPPVIRRLMRPIRPEQHCTQVRSPASQSQISRW